MGGLRRPDPARTGAQERQGVVVVNDGSHHLLQRALDVPLADDFVVVVVDNFSTSDERRSVAALAADHEWVLVPMTGKPGFAAAVNAGAAEAFSQGCDTVALLNPDAQVPVEVLRELARECRADPMTMAAPRLVDGLSRPHFHGSEVELASGRIRGSGQPRLTGACLAMHRTLFELLGGLDERYFLYWEDVDLAYRATRHGARLVIRPDLVGRHDEGGSQGRRRGRAKSARYYFYNARNRLRFAARHLSRQDLVRWLAATPSVSTEILLRGGRRQLLRSPLPLLAVTAGSVAGAMEALHTLAARNPPREEAPAGRREGALKVTVAMLTFHRADHLAEVLPLLLAQAEAVADSATSVEVLVVDNDPAGSGAAVVRALRHPRLRAVVEPTPGIAAARNRAIDETADRDVLVFIDDDERPHDGWLRHLVATFRATGADAVAGPVVSVFTGPMDPWVDAGAFFRRRRRRTGSEIRVAATNNLLLDLDTVREAGVRFDRRFGLWGIGEDTLFTRSLVQRGARLVWCDEALVTDVVPVERMTAAWVLRRALASGNAWSITHVALQTTPVLEVRGRLAAASRGVARCAVGGARFAGGVLGRSTPHRARGLRTLYRGAGMLLGAAGVVYQHTGAPVDDT